jgi:hypothetical protein
MTFAFSALISAPSPAAVISVHDRHGLLSALFEKPHVHHGQIFGCTPRGDRVNRVRLLLGTALDYVDGPGAATRDVERRGRDLNSRWASNP